MAAAREQTRAPAVVLGVVVDGQLLLQSLHGSAGAGSRPVTADTEFRIASMTKSFTALAVLKLRDEGRLGLDDEVSRYVPEMEGWPRPTADAPAITIRHLLTHTAGFPEDNAWGDRQLAISDAELSAWLRRGVPFSNPTGLAYEYSNYGFALLGRIVARASGRPFRQYVDAEILKPLGLRSSHWEAASVPPAHLASGHRRQGEGLAPETPLGDGAFGAMGGLYTSSQDLARYLAFLLSAWPPRDEPDAGPVRRATVREMGTMTRFHSLSVTRDAGGFLQASASGYGFGVNAYRDCAIAHGITHSGGLPGYGSNMRLLPEHGVAVFAMANVTYAPMSRLTQEVVDALARTGALQPRRLAPAPVLVETRDRLARLVQRWDDREAAAVAADNLFLDRPAEERRAELDRLRVTHGACTAPSVVDPENALRGRFHIPCERGRIDVRFTLAPTSPPRVQVFSVTSVLTDARKDVPPSDATCIR